MGIEARVHDAESMKTWKKPHAVAGIALAITIVLTAALIAAANGGDGAAALTSNRRSQSSVPRAEGRQPVGDAARPTFDGAPLDGDATRPSDDRRHVDPTTSTTSTPTSTTSTTVDDRRPLACRNSTNPQCGPFRWDPQPLPNGPMQVDVKVSPSNPRVGDVVTFTVMESDADAPGQGIGVVSSDFGDGHKQALVVDGGPCDWFGPWTPPAPQAGQRVRTYTHTYGSAGTFVARFTDNSGSPNGNPGCEDPTSHRSGDPFASHGEGAISVAVANPAPTTVTVSEADDGKTVALRAGDYLNVTLQEDPTTGFRWVVVEREDSRLRPAGDQYAAPDPGPDGSVGGGGQRLLRFQALGAGPTRLRLEYRRVNDAGPPARTWSLVASVRP
jgi:inhibitor of cysteine peptidase